MSLGPVHPSIVKMAEEILGRKVVTENDLWEAALLEIERAKDKDSNAGD